MPRLKLYLLGAPRIELDGVPITVDTRKAIALAAFLAVTDESHSREAIANLLWPEYDQRRAHAALRRTLSTLNKALQGAGLKIDRETVSLDGAAFWTDLGQFRARLAECRAHGQPDTTACEACLGPLSEAAGLARGDFLAGFTLRDSPNFDEWQFFQAESLRRELAAVLERLAGCLAARGDFEAAIAHARRWLALDPLQETAHRRLMQLYASTGQRAAALRQYEECARILEDELGVSPLEETQELYAAIKEGRGRAEWEQESKEAGRQGSVRYAPGVFAMLQEQGDESLRPRAQMLPLVGRAAEWAELLAAYEAIRSDGRLIILEGEAGIGKTRLAEAFIEQARGRGAAAIRARCYEGESNLAYGPFIEALRSATRASPGDDGGLARWAEAIPPHWLSEAARLLPELAGLRPDLPPATPLDGPGAQSRFFEGVSRLILALLQGRRPGLLFVDDLHWADEASLDLLTYVARRLRGQPIAVLGTWRGEQVPAGHRLRQLALEAGRNGMAAHIALSRLNQPAVTELVQAALPDQGNHLTERLFRESEGLPFFVVEYLAMLADRAPEAGGQWTLPAGVHDLLASRLALVSETGRQLLSAAAVVGRSFDFDTLQAASGRSGEETVAGLESLIAHGLVREVRGEEGAGQWAYDFSHEKLRALVYEETSLARRRLLHARIAEALELRARRRRQAGELAGQIAEHYRLGGREKEAAQYFRQAGEHARALYANAEALAHFRSALALGPQAEADAAALHEAIGDLQTLAGDYGAALAAYEATAARLAPEALARLEHKVGNVYHRRGEWELAEKHFQAALRALEGKETVEAFDERARLYADWSLTTHRRGAADRAQELAEQALALAEAAGDPRALALAHNILGILASSRQDIEQARRHLERSLALAEALDDLGARVAALNNLALAYRRDAQLDQALALTRQALGLCASQGDRHREAALHNNMADLLHEAGRGEEAMSHLKRAVAIFAEIGAEAAAGTWQPEIWKLTEW